MLREGRETRLRLFAVRTHSCINNSNDPYVNGIALGTFNDQTRKEKQLRHALWEIRDAIDRYKETAERGGFQIRVDTNGYPPTLDELVKGVDVQGKKMRFLRRLPVDPMTGNADWGMRSMQDDPDSDSWGGQNVFDVYTKSQSEGLDGTKYKDW